MRNITGIVLFNIYVCERLNMNTNVDVLEIFVSLTVYNIEDKIKIKSYTHLMG